MTDTTNSLPAAGTQPGYAEPWLGRLVGALDDGWHLVTCSLANLRRRLWRIHRNAHHFRACLPQFKHLLDGCCCISSIGIGHALHDDRRVAAELHAAEDAGNQQAALEVVPPEQLQEDPAGVAHLTVVLRAFHELAGGIAEAEALASAFLLGARSVEVGQRLCALLGGDIFQRANAFEAREKRLPSYAWELLE